MIKLNEMKITYSPPPPFFFQVLVEEHIDLLQAFEVTAVPAVLGIHRGMVVGKFVGLVSHKEVTGFVDKLLTN